MKKRYQATTPDGKDTQIQESVREYKYATWIQFPSEPHQKIISYSKSSKPILGGGKYWKHFPHGVVPCHEVK